MSYIPSAEALNQYEPKEQSIGSEYKDYMQGLGAQLLQSGSNAGYQLGMLPSYGYEALTGKKGYSLKESPDLSEFIPQSESGQLGQQVGDVAGDIMSYMIPGRIGYRGLRALSRYHPFTKGQMGRQFQRPIETATEAGIRAPISYQQLQELNQLLSHPALAARGGAGRSLTPQGIGSLIQGGSQGDIPALHSAQSLLGDLERFIPGTGESYLARTQVRPMKEQILESMQNAMRAGGQAQAAEEYQHAREAARRYYRTNKAVKKVIKPIAWIAAIKSGMSALKKLP